ncbi:flagellar hook-length control protein FliK [Paenibacillaceae bacterium GAS479]|nr:flagellar hook-length control protein FliK [Paenibacillaceae bacterium GAS479]
MEMAVSQPMTPAAGSTAAGAGQSARQGGSTTSGQTFQQVMGSAQTSSGSSPAAASQTGATTSDATAAGGETAAALIQAALAQLTVDLQKAKGTLGSPQAGIDGAAALPGQEGIAGQLEVDLTNTDLLGQLEALLDKLFAAGEEAIEIPEQDWQAAASELSALLALLGLPVQQMLAAQSQEVTDGMELQGVNAAGSGSRQLVLESLLMLGQALETGAAPKIGSQDASTMIQQQMGKLESLLKGETKAQDSDSLPASGDTNAGKGASAAPAAAMLLARLNASSVHVRAALEAQGTSPAANVDNVVAGEAAVNTTVAPVMTSSEQPQGLIAGTPQSPVQPAPASAGPAAPVPVVSIHRFAEELGGMIIQKLDITSLGQATEARIMLNPEHLGQVDIKLQLQSGQLTAVFMADSPAAREAIENQLAQLRQSLQLQGIQVERMEVSSNQLQSSFSFGQQSHGGGQQRQSFTGDRSVSEEAALREADLTTQTVIRELGFGRAVNETA